jgi:hypothetical protein
LWIVQEVLLAKKIVLYFGDEAQTTQDWDILTAARKSVEGIPAAWETDTTIAILTSLTRECLPFWLDRQREFRDRGWSFQSLVMMTEKSLCQDPRDKIYGLLGLAQRKDQAKLDIDYSKRMHELYQDVMRWYHNTQVSLKDSFSLGRFSQMVQRSFEGHWDPNSVDPQPNLGIIDKIPMRHPLEMFRITATLKGTIFPLEQFSDIRDIMDLCQQDTIFKMVECLHDASRRGSKEDLEKELVYLDSIIASFGMPSSSAFAYAMDDGDMSHSHYNANQQHNNSLREPKANPKAFMTEDEGYGIASSNIREGDSVCQFKNSKLGVVLRRKRDCYMLVSRAIFSPSSAQAAAEELVLQQKSFDSVLKVSCHDNASTKEENHHNEAERTVVILLDAATLHALTRPVKFNDKHKSREPLCIQESSFGWYEFIKFGVLSEDDARLFPALNINDASYHGGNIIPSKWRSIWSILTNSFQRLWLLFRLIFCLSKILHNGFRMIDVAAARNVRALLHCLRDLNGTRINSVSSTQKNRRMAIVA